MSAEGLCTTYYLVLLFSMWTPALQCGVYLLTCLCLTLCAPHRRSLLCFFLFFVCLFLVMLRQNGPFVFISGRLHSPRPQTHPLAHQHFLKTF